MAMVGKDVATKLLMVTGRSLRTHNEWSDLVRQNDPWHYLWLDAGIREVVWLMAYLSDTYLTPI